jgi:hypothetical protein
MKKIKSPSEKLREKLESIHITEDPSQSKKSFRVKDFIRDAKAVKATFSHENLQQFTTC